MVSKNMETQRKEQVKGKKHLTKQNKLIRATWQQMGKQTGNTH